MEAVTELVLQPINLGAASLSTESPQIRPEVLQSLLSRQEFPDITLAEFRALPRPVQEDLLKLNRVVNTDTYNRTMAYLASKRESSLPFEQQRALNLELGGEAVFALQMRRSPFDYIVAAGVERMINEVSRPISASELNFACELYQEANIPFFNQAMWESVVYEKKGRLPISIQGVRDGTVTIAGEPLCTVRGPAELCAHFEHHFHRMFYMSMVATRAREILEIIGDPRRFIEVGKRGAVTEEQHMMALEAMRIGGGFTATSNDAAVALLNMRDTGTMGHRYVQSFSTVEAAFRHAYKHLPSVAFLVDLTDSYEGIDIALKIKLEERENLKPAFARLDSGDILDQVRYFLTRTNELGLTDPRYDGVIVEGIDSLEELRDIEKMVIAEFGERARARVRYAAGGLLIAEQTSRSDASTGLKLAVYTDEHGIKNGTMKFSNSPTKESYPGDQRLVITESGRQVALVGEDIPGVVCELFEPLMIDGVTVGDEEAPSSKTKRTERQFRTINEAAAGRKLSALRAIPSPQMSQLIAEVRGRYGMDVH